MYSSGVTLKHSLMLDTGLLARPAMSLCHGHPCIFHPDKSCLGQELSARLVAQGIPIAV